MDTTTTTPVNNGGDNGEAVVDSSSSADPQSATLLDPTTHPQLDDMDMDMATVLATATDINGVPEPPLAESAEDDDADMMEAIATLTEDVVDIEDVDNTKDDEIKAAMATLTNVATSAATMKQEEQQGCNKKGDDGLHPTTATTSASSAVGGGTTGGSAGAGNSSEGKPSIKPPRRIPVWMQTNTPAKQALNDSKPASEDDDAGSSMDTSDDDDDDEEEEDDDDDDIPVAVPVDDDDNDAGDDEEVVATIVDEKKGNKSNTTTSAKPKDGKNNNATTKTANNKRGGKRKASTTTSTGGGGGGRSKSYQGSYRTAAAAHRNRQIHVPPIGSPGLLMLPTPAATASFPPSQTEEEARKRWLIRDAYLLPSTVFRQSMIAGGYTIEKRNEKPHRGSSTERTVGDMFDSDVNLYLHFPELIPLHVWERRLGDEHSNNEIGEMERPVTSPEKVKKEKGGGEGGGGGAVSALDTIKKDGTIGSSGSGTNTKSSNGKDDNNTKRGPKGARSSYIFFTNAQRPKMVAEFPGMRFTEQGVIMGERWRALTPEEKKSYEDMANKDKERYSREMKEYIESVKREIMDEKSRKGGGGGSGSGLLKQGGQSATAVVPDEQKSGGDDKKEPSITSSKKDDTSSSSQVTNEIRGPRLVDSMILSLSKLLGQKVNRKEMPPPPSLEPKSSPEFKPDAVVSSSANPPPPPHPHRRVSPDLTLAELPQFTTTSSHRQQQQQQQTSQTRQQSSTQHQHTPFTFLDMLPTSLTTSYPPTYVSQRRAYAAAIRAREDAIIDAQEAKDDADDAQEKYVAHTEAWERMLEYQRGLIGKREAERKRQREKEAAERKEAEEDKKDEDGNAAASSSDGGGDDKNEGKVTTDENNASTDNNGSAKAQEKKARLSPNPPPPEDPMEYMPPRPQPPGPARVVSIPDIPIPPSPPPIVEMGQDDNNGGCRIGNAADDQSQKVDEAGKKSADNSTKKDVIPMMVPKLNHKLLQHLDPSCFLPTMSEGRYFGLLSNHIADPQFDGMSAPGIAGTTYGGGTGLATSYVGGGRGAAGLVAGSSRGGSLWQTQSSAAGASVGPKSNGEKSQKRRLSSAAKEKEETPDEVKSKAVPKAAALSPAPVPDAVKSSEKKAVTPVAKQVVVVNSSPPPTTPASTTTKKRPASSNDDASPLTKSSPPPTSSESTEKSKKKKQKRTTFGLATGDRNTTATEIASGTAGDEFPDGWIIKTYRRSGGETIGKTDRFWFSPGRNIRFRAKKHAKAFVEILGEPGVGGDEDKAAEVYRARGLHF
ncbi:hypothetical protein ACHAXR_012595 [Thalassiosira sp. AJA248-18]